MTIYVLRSDNLVKIGFTDDLRKRVRAIIATIPMPVEYVGQMPGDRMVERHLHQCFEHSRFAGEWFRETPEMRRVFDALLMPGLPDIEVDHPVRLAKKKSAKDDVKRVSKLMRAVTALEWPMATHMERVERLAAALMWNKSRVRDLYYADRRAALRAFEMDQLTVWLESRQVPA